MRIKKVFLLASRLVLLLATSAFCLTGGVVCADLPNIAPLRSVKKESKTDLFNESIVDHAKKLCNECMYKNFSHNGSGFIDFWFIANEGNLDLERAYSCTRLFYNNIKSCNIVDNTVVEHVSRTVPKLFCRYFEKKNRDIGSLEIIKDNVEDLMLGRFIDQHRKFQAQPDVFITKLSTDITNLVKIRFDMIRREKENEEFREKMRSMMIRFLDLIIGKTYWDPNSYISIWPSFMSIADKLYRIGRCGIINDQDNLDELWDSLVKRFVWYLDVHGSELPVEFYEQIEEDLKNRVVFFLEIDEQDKGIKRKKELIAEAVVNAKAKAIAYERGGIITDQVIKV
jgi:hypothetical protein